MGLARAKDRQQEIIDASQSKDVQDQIVLGNVAGVTHWTKFGYRNTNTAAGGEETIWATSGNLVIMTTPDTFTITYNSGTDGAGTTGALVLQVWYLDGAFEPQVTTHTLGNTGSDETNFSGLGINRVAVVSSGTVDTNTNDITFEATGSGDTQAIVPALNGVTQQAIFHIGINQTAVAKLLYVNAAKSGGGNPEVTVKGYSYNRLIDTYFEVFRSTLDTAVQDTINIIDPIGFALGGRDVIYFVMDTDTNNTLCDLRFSLNLYDV